MIVSCLDSSLLMVQPFKSLSHTAKSCLDEEARCGPNALVDEPDVASMLSSKKLMNSSKY
jgi:hypothetical protein